MPTEVKSTTQSELTGQQQEEAGHLEQQEEAGHGPDIRKFDQSTILGKVQTVYVVLRNLSFLLLWASTAMLLYTYSKKLGKVKFWAFITIPIAIFLSVSIIITPFVLSVSSDSNEPNTELKIMVDALGYTLPAVVSSILFSLPFLMIARNLSNTSILKVYMIIAGSGFALFALAISSSIMLAAYPPFGIASVSFVGLSSFLIMIGIYSSAVSLAHDVKLRELIRSSTFEQTRLLDSIGTAHMESEITGRVLKIVKDNRDKMEEETGVKASFTDEELIDYLNLVHDEVRMQRRKKGDFNDSNLH